MQPFYIESETGRQVTDLSTVDPAKFYVQSGTGQQIQGSALLPQTTTASAPTSPVTSLSSAAGLTTTNQNLQTLQQYETAYAGPSIVDYLSSTGQSSDYASREKLAAEKGIQNYTGTAEQNTQLLGILRGITTSPVLQ